MFFAVLNYAAVCGHFEVADGGWFCVASKTLIWCCRNNPWGVVVFNSFAGVGLFRDWYYIPQCNAGFLVLTVVSFTSFSLHGALAICITLRILLVVVVM